MLIDAKLSLAITALLEQRHGVYQRIVSSGIIGGKVESAGVRVWKAGTEHHLFRPAKISRCRYECITNEDEMENIGGHSVLWSKTRDMSQRDK
eukprot:scaffold25470_cov78-Skeletonema_dohrnii-CCMP3373.AAC.2